MEDEVEEEFVWPKERGVMTEITHTQFDYMLNVLPPVCVDGMYGMLEAQEHDADNKPVRHWFNEANGKCWCVLGIRNEANVVFKKYWTDFNTNKR